MLRNLLIGLAVMVVCLLLQSVLLIAAVRYYRRHEHLPGKASFWSGVALVAGVMLLLVAGNMAQVAVWALLFVMLDEFQQFSDAFYHSAVNFATLGYGDIVMSARYRLLGPLESINGALMIGVSTAALMSVFQDVLPKLAQMRRR
ncbi:potassium channel family protein [Propionivibrio limicola]|uniref:potassium channel family protein n=1 Tax=Propionivibrio limicola TaxID=167645 RepID=UPI0012916D74|nr:potassium channel family protein [Propionivibrio limicola]